MRCACSIQQNHQPGCLTYNRNLVLCADNLCFDGPDVQEGKRRSIARVTIPYAWTDTHTSLAVYGTCYGITCRG